MKKILGMFLMIAIILLAGNLLHAAIIYEQYGGPVGGNNPFCYNNLFVAQDFTVASDSNLTKLTFNAFTTAETVPLTDIYAKIYSNNNGVPGSLIYDNHITGSFTGVATGTFEYYTLRDYEITLPSQNLTTGTYWLALKVAPAQWDMHWSIPTNDTIGYVSKSNYYGGTIWDDYGTEHSFRLESSAVPLPSALLLFAPGLAGLAALRRRFTK
ncbi:MAG: VPLPA-CTERM sorting domain-containing protein [Proteobacteria bacterium]|nr:VPLPA-CTERM sorting domain-containing protein [Pseudomonadota bacterium]